MPQAKAPLPALFWISVDPDLPMAVWNKEIGAFTSAAWTTAEMDADFLTKYIHGEVDYLPFIPNPNYGVRAVSAFTAGLEVNYRVEYNAELARRAVNPLLPSRLSAVFAFGTKADARKAAQAAGRPRWEVYAFKLVDHPLARVHRANMNIVSLMRRAERVGMLDAETNHSVWSHYWKGGEDLEIELPSQTDFRRKVHNSGVMWEYLIEGRLDVQNLRHENR